MAVKGFQGTSLLDYPGRIASLLFFGGCNMVCPFCHNPALVLQPDTLPDYPGEDLLADLAARRSFIDGVVISGGEPTLDPTLEEWLSAVKRLGLLVKLDTNGLLPGILSSLLARGLVDYVALDLKTSPARYRELGAPQAPEMLAQTVRLLLEGAVDYEFRTTCVPPLVGETELLELGNMVRGGRRWALQQFHPGPCLDPVWREVEPYPADTMEGFARMIGPYAGEVVLRGL